MIISHKHKLIFIKNRKTAGTTIEALLRPHLGINDICTGSKEVEPLNTTDDWQGHMPWQKIQRIAGRKAFAEYKKFCVERNSYDKVVSDWQWHTRLGYTASSLYDWVQTRSVSDWHKYSLDDKPVCTVFQFNDLGVLQGWLRQFPNLDVAEFSTVHLKHNPRPPTYTFLKNETDALAAITKQCSKEIVHFGYKIP